MVDLPEPGRADDAQRLALADLEADVVQDGFAVVIAEVHVLEPQRAGRGRERLGARLVVDGRLKVEDLEQARAAGRRAGRRHHDHDHLTHRALQDGEVEDERRHDARRHLAGGDLVPAVPEHQRHGDIEGQRGCAHGPHAQNDALVGLLQRLARRLVELGQLERARGEGPHDADALQVLFHGERQNAHQGLHPHPGDAQEEAHPRERENTHRHERQGQQRHDRVGGEHHPGRDHDQKDEGQRHHHPVLDEHARALEVDHPPRDQVAGVDLVVEAEREALQLAEIVEAKLVGDLLADPLRLETAEPGQDALDDADADHHRRADPERGQRAAVHRRLHRRTRVGVPGQVEGDQAVAHLVDGVAEEARLRSGSPRPSPRNSPPPASLAADLSSSPGQQCAAGCAAWPSRLFRDAKPH